MLFFCDQDLTLQKPIYADSGGYDGGSFVLSSGTCSDGFPANNYAYNGSITLPQSGAYKGEGVAAVTSGQNGGRGAPARNGGGGGNNHNNSGGGGANLKYWWDRRWQFQQRSILHCFPQG